MKAASGVPTQKQKQDGKSSRRAPKIGRRIVRRRRLDDDLAGQHDLLELAGPDPLDRRGDGPLVVAGRARRADLDVAPVGCGIEQRRASASRSAARAGAAARSTAPPRRPARRRRRRSAVSQQSSPRAQQRELGQDHQRRRQRGPLRRRARRRRRRRSRRSRPGPAPAGSRRARPRSRRRGAARRSRAATSREAVRPPRDDLAAPSRAPPSAKPSRSGCSQQNQRSAGQPRGEHGRRGSSGSTSTVTLASVRAVRGAVDRATQRRQRDALSAAVGRARRRIAAVLGVRLGARDRDLAGADHLDQAVRADHALEGLDLVVRCRSPRSSASGGRRRRSWPGRSRRTA